MVERNQAEARKALRAAGVTVTARGPLSEDQWRQYEAMSGGYEGGTSPDDFASDELAAADEASFPDAQGHAAEPNPLQAEGIPRPVGGQSQPKARGKGSARVRAQRVWKKAGAAATKPKTAARGGRGPWLPTATVIEHIWSQLAWSARPLPPLQKILAAQAPMAGVTLQDAMKGGFIDRVVLQPAARAEHKLQAANAMLGPPIWTALIATMGGCQTHPQAGPDGVMRDVPLLDEDGQYVWDGRTQAMVGGLRFSLMSWLKVAEKHADDIMADAAELQELGDEADKLIRWILAPPEPGQSAKDVEREARARGTSFARAAESHANGRAPAAEPAAAPSSAFTPAPARGPSGSKI